MLRQDDSDSLGDCDKEPSDEQESVLAERRAVAAHRRRNTKIHALADVKGRLLAILLTGGEAHDCPVAERLIRRTKPSKHMLGDKAYDSAEQMRGS